MHAILPSLLAGLATALGCLVVLLSGIPGRRSLAVMLGGAAGVMLAVVLLDLVPAALQTGTPLEAGLGILCGIGMLWLLDHTMNRRSGSTPFHKTIAYRRLGYLIATGIALHDLPEGIAIAGAYTVGEKLGALLALSIALHNIPEGIATAAPLLMGGLRRRHILGIILIVSLCTPLGTILGLFLLHLSPGHLSFLLALAAGAMIYLIKDELLPAAQQQSIFYCWFGVLCGYFLLWLACILR
jgi:ZIP family zinc transporter